MAFLFLILYPIFVTHHLSHTTLSPTIFHTQLCHTPSFTHHFVTHHLSHTTLSHTIFYHTIFHTPLCHTPSLTHHLSHTTLSHTIFHMQLCHTHNFVLLLGPAPPPLSFLPSPSPVQHVALIIGRSCLVVLSGPLIF